MPKFLDATDNIKRLAYMLSEGLSNATIAQELGVSERSIPRWRKHQSVKLEVDKLINSKSQKIDEIIESEYDQIKNKIKRFSDRSQENLHQLQQTNLKLFKLLNAKIDELTTEDLSAKLIFSTYKTLVESYKVANELEADYLGIEAIMKKLEELSGSEIL